MNVRSYAMPMCQNCQYIMSQDDIHHPNIQEQFLWQNPHNSGKDPSYGEFMAEWSVLTSCGTSLSSLFPLKNDKNEDVSCLRGYS